MQTAVSVTGHLGVVAQSAVAGTKSDLEISKPTQKARGMRARALRASCGRATVLVTELETTAANEVKAVRTNKTERMFATI
jgi:hypothetical protein